MIELGLIFLGGLLGSAHCVGMCGGFALSIGMGSRGLAGNLARQLVYSLGRISTYAFLGLAAGFAGLWLGRKAGALMDASAILSIVAGLLLMGQGLIALGLVPKPGLPGNRRPTAPCLMSAFYRPYLTSPHRRDVFIAGVLTGFLPCGLVYGYLALASSTAGMLGGLVTMLLFGAGTVPLMVLAGAGASFLSVAARRDLLRIAACCVLVTGLIAVDRGIRSLQADRSSSPLACPSCETSEV